MGDGPDQRDEPGMSLIEMAIAFVLDHPALTAAIIGPRAIDPLESQLPAADVSWTTGCFERIDETVPPGLNVNPADAGWVTRPPSGGAAALTSTPSGKAATARARASALAEDVYAPRR